MSHRAVNICLWNLPDICKHSSSNRQLISPYIFPQCAVKRRNTAAGSFDVTESLPVDLAGFVSFPGSRRAEGAQLVQEVSGGVDNRKFEDLIPTDFRNPSSNPLPPGLLRMSGKVLCTMQSPIPMDTREAEIAQSVQRFATGWKVRWSNPDEGATFRTPPDRPWGTPTLL
jgi:hypothetical protein